MITAPLLSLFVIPAIYLLWRQRRLRQGEPLEEGASVREAEMVPTLEKQCEIDPRRRW
jgi:hypothetical protein